MVATPNCVNCGTQTIPQETRRNNLLAKGEEYNKAKLAKKERLHQWKLWKKTKSMFWKKTSTDYEKWEYFTDSEDEYEQAEKDAAPILPENDPQFQAMKADLDARAKRIKIKAKDAEALKNKGNEFLKKKNYSKAIEYYTMGLDKQRSNKALWTNRALAYLKSRFYNDCVSDCSRILESMEVLEDGYEKSKGFAFKALCRRAQGNQGLEKYELALEDVEECLKLFPEDKSVLDLKETLLTKCEIKKEIEKEEEKWSVPEEFEKGLSPDQQKLRAEIESFVLYKDKELSEEDRKTMKEYDFFGL